VHKLPPTSYYQQIDTLEVAKKEFGFPSNKLDGLARFLDIPGKIPTGLSLWVSVMQGDPISIKYMEEYNRNDIIVLEKIYLRMRPYIKSHPNLNLYSDINEAVCPTCGSHTFYKTIIIILKLVNMKLINVRIVAQYLEKEKL
jgi:hypothetical protein